MFFIYEFYDELNQMSQMDIIVLPTIYVCALVTGFLMNTCSKRKIIRELEDKIDTLECENDVLNNRLGDAEQRLRAISQHLTEPIDS
jgi:chaperonin cofactor prefoldin